MASLLANYQPRLDPSQLPAAIVRALYVHIPFCFHKCHYCDFYSITRQTEQRMTQFVHRILAEADQWTSPDNSIRVRPETVFFGGGTPSLLPIEPMRQLLNGLQQRFDFSQLREWTVECNPATVTAEYCRMLRESGVNRLSFGAQSFRTSELATLERHHDPEDVPRSLDLARSAGFSRLNIDLIYAIPGQELSSWQESLEKAIALRTPHISAYGLTYEPNTPMAVKKRMGAFHAVEESVELAMLHFARDRLATQGFQAYEISNYAVPGEQCQHNLMYWRGEDYVGLGPSAASHLQGWRWKNRGHLGEWERAVDEGAVPTVEVEQLPPRQRAGELAMLMLRLIDGLEFDQVHQKTDLDAAEIFADQINRYTTAGLLERTARGVKLTEKAIDVADAVAAEFL